MEHEKPSIENRTPEAKGTRNPILDKPSMIKSSIGKSLKAKELRLKSGLDAQVPSGMEQDPADKLGGHKTLSHKSTPEFLQRSVMRASSLAGAGIVTVGLWSVMVGLIADEFEPQDRLELAAFEINATPDDLPLLTDRTPPKLLDRIEVPPPPPVVDVPVTDRPVEPFHTPGNPKDIFDPKPYIVPTKIPLHPTDSDPTPLVRVPPTMPPRASRSGHCRLSFDISSDGTPYNVRTTICSQSLFESAAIRSVQKWVYRPMIENGLPVTRTGLNTLIRFNLSDERGVLIPE
ncbi:hypothetical protein GCM10009069_15410 [Algimonas arctica]|uniref:TonB C-terminal domain-containing protein n=1 Tax=Algimonas arctica TaxID=1479486 RepID=A0A8J3G2A8_9PROT|nr:energy transducer TonB [Algimonas arctica]GHA93283.1 hypothetical protein GCM10009069_15410 [Algimonas arctica]